MLKSFKRLPLAAALVAASLTPVAHGADWSDAFIGIAQGSKFREPGNPLENEKTVATAQYVGGYKYGVNFFTVDMLQSGPNDLARGSKRPAQELYAVYNNTVSLGKLGMDTKFGLIRDIGFQAGFDFNSKNDAFGAGLVKFIAGPKLELDVPGLLTVGAFYYKEDNNNSISGKNVNFDSALRIGSVWSFNFNAGLPATFKGWATWTGNKGKDGFGDQTAPETWMESALLFDIGSAMGAPKIVYGGLGYQYIKNKFGNQPSLTGTKVSSPSVKLEYHF
jgi:hypothetical protein